MDSWINSLRQSVTPQRPRVRTKGRLCRPSLKTPSRPFLRTQARVSRSPAIIRDRTPPFVCKRGCQPNAKATRVDTARRTSNRRRWGPPQVVFPGNASDLRECANHFFSSSPILPSRHLRSSSRICAAKDRYRSVERGATPPTWAEQSVSAPFAIAFKNKKPDTELMEAVCKADLKAMLEALPKTTELSMEAALVAATRRAQPALVAALLAAGADPEAQSARAADDQRLAPLHWAAADGARLRCADLLLRAGTYVDVTTASGLTPLHMAALHDCADCALRLLNAGADFGALDAAGRTPGDYGGRGFALALDAFFRRPSI